MSTDAVIEVQSGSDVAVSLQKSGCHFAMVHVDL